MKYINTQERRPLRQQPGSWWKCVGALVVAVCLAQPAASSAQDTVLQWRRWEKTIVSSRNFTSNGGNPYRDLTLRVQFSKRGSVGTFVQDAFWLGDTAPTSFKVRATFSPGTWDWQVVGCTGTTGGQNCVQNTSWTPSSGSITVTSNTSSGIRLYDRGLLVQNKLLSYTYPPYYRAFSNLFYGDGITPFYWAGDTAWPAPAREIGGQSSSWISFLNDRRAKGFTGVLIAPAVHWNLDPSGPWPLLPNPVGLSFLQSAGCSGVPIPNDCTKPNPSYWDAFDTMIQQANARDLVVGIVGLVDPATEASYGAFPNQENAEDFGRYLAARLAGNHVIFSPGFDTNPASLTAGGTTESVVMESVGRAVKEAAPRHIVTNHLWGSASTTEYQSFADRFDPWMTFYLFQSGHNNLTAAVQRAREMPLTLDSFSSPAMPSINGEAPYDAISYDPNHPVDNRYRVRHAGHLSSLSDAVGYTYGAYRIVFWDQPSSDLGLPSATDMRRLADRFRDRAGLPSRHSWILNQSSSQAGKMVLASDDSSLVLAYLPGESPTDIVIGTSALPTLSCGTEWTRSWFDAISNQPLGPSTTCTQGSDRITVQKPACGLSGGNCDWFFQMEYSGSALSATPGPAVTETVEVWSEPSAEGGTSAIVFSRSAPSLEQKVERSLVSSASGAFQSSPRVARLNESYLVVWEADGTDGSLLGVFAQRVNPRGDLVGRQVQVNQYSEHDQARPAVATDGRARAAVAWSSYGQDGDLGEIFLRRYDGFLSPLHDEIKVNEESRGHQTDPRVVFDAEGNVVVAWRTEIDSETPARISFRRLSGRGTPLGPEVVVTTSEIPLRLAELAIEPLGTVRLRWVARDLAGALQGTYSQRFNLDGQALGGPEQEF